MKKIILAAAMGASMLLTGCLDIESLNTPKINITPPKPPTPGTKNEVDMLAEEVHAEPWYDQICEHILNEEFVFIVDGKLGNNEVSKTLALLHTDHPEIFWLDSRCHGKIASEGSEVGFEIMNCIEEDDIPKMRKELDDAVKEIIAGVPDGSDYDKIVYVHDYIINNTKYDHKGADSDKFGLWLTTYGCLVEGKAVCEGYAEAFTLLMNELGIESGVCIGSNHAWNYVKVEGDYYWLDTTWDDYDGSNAHAQHTYCLVNDEQLLRSRSFSNYQYYVPDCTATKNNYLVKNGGYFETYDRDAVLEYAAECADKGQCELMFGSFEAFSEALDDLLANGKIYTADGIDKDNLKHTRTDNMFYVEFLW